MKIPFTNIHIKAYRSPQRKQNQYIHPDYQKAIEYCFSLEGQDFYRFKNIGDMPVERWHQMTGFLTEMQMRIDRDTLEQFAEEMQKAVDNGKLTTVATYIEQIKWRLGMMLETDTLYRFATCVFFTMDEPLKEYDWDINEPKLNLFKRQKINDFFFMEPVKTLIPLVNISEDVIQAYLKETKILRRYEEELTKLNNARDPKPSDS